MTALGYKSNLSWKAIPTLCVNDLLTLIEYLAAKVITSSGRELAIRGKLYPEERKSRFLIPNCLTSLFIAA